MNKHLSIFGLCLLLVLTMELGVIAQEAKNQAEPQTQEHSDKDSQADSQAAPKKEKQAQEKGGEEPERSSEEPQQTAPKAGSQEKSQSEADSEQNKNQKKESEQDKEPGKSEDKPQDKEQDQQDVGPFSRDSFSLFRGTDSYRESSKRAKNLVSIVKPLVVSAEASTVKILNGNRLISLGTVVDRNGLILTKASELRGDLKCKLADGRQSNAVVVGVHESTDLALLRVELDDLQPIHWGQEPVAVVGQWIASPVLDEVKLGVVGVNARKIPVSEPFIGIAPALGGDDGVVGAKINSVSPNTPADKANLMVGDTITKIDDVEIKDWPGLRRTLGQYDPNDEVTLTIQRGKEELKIKIILGNKEKYERENSPFPQQDRSNMQNSMGSRPSQRRKGFPLAFQHDLGLSKTTCGGPVVNLDGQVIGINIARAGRVDSLALPVSTILPILESLKSGELAPEKINQTRLAELEKELAEIVSKLDSSPETGSMENQLLVEQARKEELDRAKAELQKALEELENRIKVVELKKGNYEKELRSIKSERSALARRKLGLEREKQSLSTGVK